MATTHRTKLRRKDLKQPDEFMTLAYWVQDFFEEHLNKVISGLVIIVVVGAAAFGIYNHVVNVRHATEQLFYDGFSALDAKNYKAAEDKFNDLVTNHPSSNAASLARFYLGLAYLNSGDLTHARAQLEDYVQSAAPASLRELAMMDLGVIYEQTHEYAKATEIYKQAAALNGPESNDARIGEARALELDGKRQAAINAYQDFLKTTPYAPQRETVVAALANLGVSPPAN
jgi:predicted negative regulator of RcsB-dependent stress response